MKRIIITAVAAAAVLGGGLATTASAMASTGPSNGQSGQLTGNRATSYPDPQFGAVQCNETQHPKFDTVSCKFTAGQLLTPGATGTVGWNSDFANSGHTTGVLTYTINPDGSGYTGQATYPNG